MEKRPVLSRPLLSRFFLACSISLILLHDTAIVNLSSHSLGESINGGSEVLLRMRRTAEGKANHYFAASLVLF